MEFLSHGKFRVKHHQNFETWLKVEVIHTFLYKQHWYKQRQAEIGKKIKQRLICLKKEYPPLGSNCKLTLFEHFSLSSTTLSFKSNRRYSRKCKKNKCVCFNYIIREMVMKMRLEMKIDHKDMT